MSTSGLILGVIINKCFCRNLLCDVYGRCVTYFNGNTRIKDILFYFCVCRLLQKLCLPILTTSLQVNFYQSGLILYNDIMKEDRP